MLDLTPTHARTLALNSDPCSNNLASRAMKGYGSLGYFDKHLVSNQARRGEEEATWPSELELDHTGLRPSDPDRHHLGSDPWQIGPRLELMLTGAAPACKQRGEGTVHESRGGKGRHCCVPVPTFSSSLPQLARMDSGAAHCSGAEGRGQAEQRSSERMGQQQRRTGPREDLGGKLPPISLISRL